MSFFKILLYAFLIYIAYQFVVGFVIPIYRTTKQVKKGFREMNERMNQHPGEQKTGSEQNANETTKGKVGDYIDFEEIKD